MTRSRKAGLALLGAALLLAAGCDRKVEPFDPNEKVETPDLSRIFPPGAERAPQDAPGGAGAMARGAPPPGVPGADAAAAAGEPIRGRIVLDDALRGRVPRGAVLFLIARASESGPPTAVKRIPDPSFPFDFEIGPDDRMIQGMPFTGPFQLTARIDADGNAVTRNPGDLQGTSAGRVAPGTQGVELRIDQVL
jgi:hypothetical protein